MKHRSSIVFSVGLLIALWTGQVIAQEGTSSPAIRETSAVAPVDSMPISGPPGILMAEESERVQVLATGMVCLIGLLVLLELKRRAADRMERARGEPR